MKKILSVCLAVCAMISVFTLTSCSNAEVDLTGKDNVYSDLSDIILYPEKYAGKTAAISSTYTVVYNFSENKIVRHTLREFDTTGTKRALYELKYSGEFPAIGTPVTVFGTLSSDRHLAVDRFEGAKNSADFEIDTLNMTAKELKNFIEAHRAEYSAGESFGKTIRIFGHLSVVEGYAYLIGLDGNGKYIWDVELHDSTGKTVYPTESGTTVNPVEVIGRLAVYEDDNVTYACIEVISIGRVESVFK